MSVIYTITDNNCSIRRLRSLCYAVHALNKEAKVVIDLVDRSYARSRFYVDDRLNASLQ